MKQVARIFSVLVAVLFVGMAPDYSFAATTAVVTVTATILPGENSISVDTNLVNFGGVSGSVSNRRFVAGPVMVTYFPGTNPWTIRVYTANPSGIPGLIGVPDPSEYIPLKVWCANYGPWLNPWGHAPDEENKYFWNGYDFNGDKDRGDVITDGTISEIAVGFDVNGDGDALDTGLGTLAQPVSEEPVWLNIPDYGDMIPGNPYTWRRLLTAEWLAGPGPGPGPGGGGGNPDTFPVFFAIDVWGVTPQDYRTTTLTFQIINE